MIAMKDKAMQKGWRGMGDIIRVRCAAAEILYKLNTSSAAKSFCQRLPLMAEVKDYSHDEKIIAISSLDITDAPAVNAVCGTFAYYEPWGNIVFFYEDFGMAAGLYGLGEVIRGRAYIKNLQGKIRMERVV